MAAGRRGVCAGLQSGGSAGEGEEEERGGSVGDRGGAGSNLGRGCGPGEGECGQAPGPEVPLFDS